MGDTFWTRRILEPDLQRYLDAGWVECARANPPSLACEEVLVQWPHRSKPIDPGLSMDRMLRAAAEAILAAEELDRRGPTIQTARILIEARQLGAEVDIALEAFREKNP